MNHTKLFSALFLATAVMAGPIGCSDDEPTDNTTSSTGTGGAGGSASNSSGAGGSGTGGDNAGGSGTGGDNAGGSGTGGDNAGGSGTGGDNAGGAGGATSSSSSGAGGDDTVPAGCEAVTLEDVEAPSGDDAFIYGAGTIPDVGSFELRVYLPVSAGTTALGEGDQANFGTCDRCVMIRHWAEPKADFFATAGTLVIDSIDGEDGSLKASVSKVKLEEVTIAGDGTSTLVDGGKCYYVSSAALSYTAPSP